jgi:hypothetical protein
VLFVAVQAAFDRQVRQELKGALRSRLRAARRMKTVKAGDSRALDPAR